MKKKGGKHRKKVLGRYWEQPEKHSVISHVQEGKRTINYETNWQLIVNCGNDEGTF